MPACYNDKVCYNDIDILILCLRIALSGSDLQGFGTLRFSQKKLIILLQFLARIKFSSAKKYLYKKPSLSGVGKILCSRFTYSRFTCSLFT